MMRTAFLLAVGACFLVLGPLAVKAADDELRVLQVENARLRAIVATRDKQVEDLKMEVSALKTEIQKTAPQAQALANEVKLLKENLAVANARLRALEPPASPTATPAKPSAPTVPGQPSQPTAPQDKWAGFRNLKWAVSIADAPKMILVEDDGDNKFYRRQDDKLTIGAAELTEIIYGFYKDRFWSLHLKVDGYLRWTALKDAVFATYGRGYQSNTYIDKWIWGTVSQTGVKDVHVSLVYDQIAKRGDLYMLYTPIIEEREAAAAKAAKEAKKDF